MEGYSECFSLLLLLPYLAGVISFLVKGPRAEPVLAVILNIFLPGIGYAYLGRWVRFALVAGPLILLLLPNLFPPLRSLVEPARLFLVRILSLGTGDLRIVGASMFLIYLAQIVDASRVAVHQRKLEVARPPHRSEPGG